MNPIIELFLLCVGALTVFVFALLFVVWVVIPGLEKLIKWVLGE